MDKITTIQTYLKENNYDAYIITDYENRNQMFVTLVNKLMLTRKVFLVIPKDAKPYIICHSIDYIFLTKLKDIYDLKIYYSWQEMLQLENISFSKYKKVLMDISINGLLPRVSLADYGSVEYIKNLGIEVFSSGDILQLFTATYDSISFQEQEYACKQALRIKDLAFKRIKEDILLKGYSDEYDIQQFICDEFHNAGMIYDDEAIVAIGKNASNPHYGPTKYVHSKININDVVLIDMWAKKNDEKGIYSDITWMGYVGNVVDCKVEERFQILKHAIDAGIKFLNDNLKTRRVEGYEVDDVVRNYINNTPYGKYFTHRTGHNISYDVSPHGPGANIDNYESHDTRRIIPHTTFSLEPGIYANDFGMRSETDVYVNSDYSINVIGGRQDKVIAILSL